MRLISMSRPRMTVGLEFCVSHCPPICFYYHLQQDIYMQCKLGVHPFTYQNSYIFPLHVLLRNSGSAFWDNFKEGRAIMNERNWTLTINRQVPEVRTKWVELEYNGEYTFILLKTLRWLIWNFSWWNKDGMDEQWCRLSKKFRTGLELHPPTDTCHYLCAMIAYQVPLDPFSQVDCCIDLARSLYDQD